MQQLLGWYKCYSEMDVKVLLEKILSEQKPNLDGGMQSKMRNEQFNFL